MTLTFKKNIFDIKSTNKEFSLFIKRLNYYIYKKKKTELKYIAVWEKQKRGAIHYHVIFFDFPWIPAVKLQAIWGHGFIKINKIDVDSMENRGRYVSKYFTKNVEDKDFKQKSFFRSQNLIQPTEIKVMLDDVNFEGKDVIFTKTYSRKVPDFSKKIDVTKEGLAYKTGKVRYTKIKKERVDL